MPSKQSKLPPLPDEAYDGEKHTIELNPALKNDHAGVYFQDGELRSPSGAAWTGPNLHILFDLLTKKSS